jgi:SP family arabinose:H+ symporter-like MFS transporter
MELVKKNYLFKITAIAALGGFLFGYDTAVISGAIGFMKIKFDLTPALEGWAVSSAILGCILGASTAGYFADRIGRKKTLFITALLFFGSAVGCMLAQSFNMLVIARIVGGIGVGAASMLSPLYISETAPAEKRGSLVSLYQFGIVLGIIIVYFCNYLIEKGGDELWNINNGWRYMLGSEAIPALIFIWALFFVPESPRFLAKKGQHQEALKILQRINTPEKSEEVHREIVNALGQEKGKLSELFGKGLKRATTIGIVLAIFSQITGINAIMYYAPEILKSAGFGVSSALMQTVLIGLINSIFTFVAIKYIDKLGRKKLLLWGVAGMALSLFMIGMIYELEVQGGPFLLFFILSFVAFFATSLGPIPWVIIAEIFPTKIRGVAMSLCVMILWIGVMLISQFTPILLSDLGSSYTFWLFMVNAIVLWVFTFKLIPETSGKTLEEIELNWKK